INVGLAMFHDDLARQAVPVAQVDWRPPAGGKPDVLQALDVLTSPAVAERISAANREAVQRILTAQPVLVGFGRALDVVPGMTRTTILHAGPPIAFDRMNGPMRGAVAGALVFEGLAKNLDDAAQLAASGE